MPLVLLLANAGNATAAPAQVVLPGAGFQDWTVTINGVDRSAAIQKRSLIREESRGGRGTLSFALADANIGSLALRAEMDQEVIYTVNGERRFGGYITDLGETPFSGFAAGTRQNVKVGDYSQIYDRLFLTAEYGTTLAPILNSNGGMFTVDGGHGLVTGDRIQISNHASAVPDLNGVWTATVLNPVNFTIPVTQLAPGGGGTVRKLWTFREVMQDIQARLLAPWGITLAPDFPEGGYLDPESFTNAKLSDVFAHFITVTGFVSRTDGNKVLDMFLPGSRYAPFALDAGSNVNGPVQITKTRSNFSNWIILEIGGDSKRPTTQVFVAPATSGAGVTTEYVTDYPASIDPNDPWPNIMIVNGVPIGTVSFGPDLPGTFAYQWDYVNHRLIDYGTATPIAPGSLVQVGYTIQYPVTVEEFDPEDIRLPPLGRGPWITRLQAPAIINLDQARAQARGELRRRRADPRTLTTGSLNGPAFAGYRVPITIPSRLVSGDWIVESARETLMGPRLFYYDYTFTEGLDVPATWQESIRELTGTSGGATGSIGGTSLIVSPTNPPVLPVTGGGKAAFFLGSTGNLAERGAALEWIPVSGRPIGDSAIQVEIDSSVQGGAATAHVRLKAADAGVAVRARVWDVTEAAEVGISNPVTSQAWETVTFPVTLTGVHTYELHIQPDVADADVFGSGYIQ